MDHPIPEGAAGWATSRPLPYPKIMGDVRMATLYNLIKKYRGKSMAVMTDQLAKVRSYKQQIASSQRKGVKGQRIEYEIAPADVEEYKKYKKPPSKMHLSGQPRRPGPKVVGK